MRSVPSSTNIPQAIDSGLAHHQAGRLQEAEHAYRQVLQVDPKNPDALHLLGVIASQVGKNEIAVDLIDKALAINPNFAEALSNRGNALQELKRYEDALASYDKALSIKPEIAEVLSNRGNVLKTLKRYDDALASYDKAISIRPDYAEALYNRGLALHELNRLDEAVASYDRAIAVKPDYADANWHKSLALLSSGDFRRGWRLYEWRWERLETKKYRRNFPQPLWLGKESLAGKTILLHSEQGFGDTIQYSRYARLVAGLGARVTMELPIQLMDLFKDLTGVSEWVAKGSPLPAFDYHCPLLSLPLAFDTDLATIPSFRRYLDVDAEHLAKWRARLGEQTRQRIGLVWSGSAEHKNDNDRSMALADLLPYLPPQYQYVSLQKEVRDEDKPVLAARSDILHFGDELKDFTDTAALCEQMHLIISVDTSVAHLAGALGKPVWILLAFRPDSRWLMERTDSPWYPSARLFRKEKIGAWDGVLERVKTELMLGRG